MRRPEGRDTVAERAMQDYADLMSDDYFEGRAHTGVMFTDFLANRRRAARAELEERDGAGEVVR